MLDIKLIREKPDLVIEGMVKRGQSESEIRKMIELDLERRNILKEVEALKYKKNQQSREVGESAKKGLDIRSQREEIRKADESILSLESKSQAIESELSSLLLFLPNLPDESVPVGLSEMDNILVREWGEIPSFTFTPKSHWELGVANRMIDFERGAKLGGNKFPLLTGSGAALSRKLGQFMLENAIQSGYMEINPPLIGKKEIFLGSGQLPKFEEDLYKIEGEESYLIPTAEVPLVNLYANEILSLAELPIKLTALTPCFRKEAGAAGKETRGLIRVHQFEKVELVRCTKPEESADALEAIVSDAEDILQKLQIPYRVVLLCTFDMTGFSTAKTYDLEIWFPSMQKYVEISSCSNCKDFQARRANIKYRDEKGQTAFVHTLNGSGLAVGRCFASLLENRQKEDGSIDIPDVLR